jgi:hypothetical protein
VTIPVRILPLPLKLDRQDFEANETGFDITVRKSLEESKDYIPVHESELEMDFGSDKEV